MGFCRFGSTRSQVRILSPRLTFHRLRLLRLRKGYAKHLWRRSLSLPLRKRFCFWHARVSSGWTKIAQCLRFEGAKSKDLQAISLQGQKVPPRYLKTLQPAALRLPLHSGEILARYPVQRLAPAG